MELPSKINVKIDYDKCKPQECSVVGRCGAAEICPKKIIRQDEPFDHPYFHPANYCRGCVKCVDGCPLGAVKKVTTT